MARKRRNTGHSGGRDLGYGIPNGRMLRSELTSIRRSATSLKNAVTAQDQVPAWVLTKVAVAMSKLQTAENYILSKLEGMNRNPAYQKNKSENAKGMASTVKGAVKAFGRSVKKGAKVTAHYTKISTLKAKILAEKRYLGELERYGKDLEVPLSKVKTTMAYKSSTDNIKKYEERIKELSDKYEGKKNNPRTTRKNSQKVSSYTLEGYFPSRKKMLQAERQIDNLTSDGHNWSEQQSSGNFAYNVSPRNVIKVQKVIAKFGGEVVSKVAYDNRGRIMLPPKRNPRNRKMEVKLPKTNLRIVGVGLDTNGNSVIRFAMGANRAFSIQTSGKPEFSKAWDDVMYYDHSWYPSTKKGSKGSVLRSPAKFAKAAIKYIKTHGSPAQKKSLKVYKSNSRASKVGTFGKKQKELIKKSYRQLLSDYKDFQEYGGSASWGDSHRGMLYSQARMLLRRTVMMKPSPLTTAQRVKLVEMEKALRARSNPRRYDYPEYIEFLYDIDYSQVPQKEKKAFEKEVDRVLQNSGLDDYVTDYDEIYYLTLASLAGHGVGLWEGREQWHLDLEKAIKYDLKATSKLRDAFFRLDENATIASLDG